MATYTVEQGDYLSKIATKFGFFDYHTIWDHSANGALKKLRQDPNVLYPGDQLFVPDKKQKVETVPTGKTHRYRVKAQSLGLRIVVEHGFERPVANVPFELRVEGRVRQMTSDADGGIEDRIPVTAEDAHLVIKSDETPLAGIVLPVRIGHLDPVSEVTGQKSRLMNLGYCLGPIDDEDTAPFRSAVEEFQCDHFPRPQRPDGVPIAVDGVCGPKTQAKLKEVHGC